MSFSFFCPTRFGRRRRKQQLQQQQQRPYEDPAFVDEPYEIQGNTQHFPPGRYNVILQNFEATMADELVVREGDIVQMLYRENDWAYVANLDGDEGYVPFSFCAEQAPRSSSLPSRSSVHSASSSGAVQESGGSRDLLKPARSPSDTKPASYSNSHGSPMRKGTPSTPDDSLERLDPSRLLNDRIGDAGSPPISGDEGDARATPMVNGKHTKDERQRGSSFPRAEQHTTYTEVHVFPKANGFPQTDSSTTSSSESRFVKKPLGVFLVLYDFTECRDDEVPVKRADIVTLLNDEDPDWAWVAKGDQSEGFVPRNFLVPINQTAKPSDPSSSSSSSSSSNRRLQHDQTSSAGMKGKSRLVVLYDFQAQSLNQLTVYRGDWVFVDIVSKDAFEASWLWVYSPEANRSGFIPANFVRPPVGLP